MFLFVTGRQPPTLPGKPASQRGNPYPLICPSPWSRRRGDKAIIGTKIAFAGRKLPNLFVGHLTDSLHPIRVCPPAGRQSTTGAAQAEESGSLDVVQRIVTVFCTQDTCGNCKYSTEVRYYQCVRYLWRVEARFLFESRLALSSRIGPFCFSVILEDQFW
jgi:hypothetical protein